MLKPFIKWAGGKQQLLPIIRNKLPKSYNRYIEPFLGSGALLLYLEPMIAIVNDTNEALINLYTQVRDNPNELIDTVSVLDKRLKESYNPKEYYLIIRDEFNHQLSTFQNDLNSAAHFLFINKHCFNGLYRVNNSGMFNVPYNNSLRDSFNRDNILQVSKYLSSNNITIMNKDFWEPCKLAEKGDFVFIDSPYEPIKDNSFDKYNKDDFDAFDHYRVYDIFKYLTEKGVYCMLTNHNVPIIRKRYSKYNIDIIEVHRSINCLGTSRKGEEIIVTNY